MCPFVLCLRPKLAAFKLPDRAQRVQQLSPLCSCRSQSLRATWSRRSGCASGYEILRTLERAERAGRAGRPGRRSPGDERRSCDLNAGAPYYGPCELRGALAGVPRLQRASVLLIKSEPRYPYPWPLHLLVTGEHICWGLPWIRKSWR